VTAEVQRVLETELEGFSALASNGVAYTIPPDRLRAEKISLLRALRSAPFRSDDISHDFEANVGRPGELTMQHPIIAWTMLEVFEIVHPDGSLQIRRLGVEYGQTEAYGVCFVKGNKVLFGGAKSGVAIDSAWRSLAQAARKKTTVRICEGVESPLKYAREIGIDFRGIEEE